MNLGYNAYRRLTCLGLVIVALAAVPAGAVDKSGVKSTVISPPSGPGSIRGLGESFDPDLVTGAGSYAIELESPARRGGLYAESFPALQRRE